MNSGEQKIKDAILVKIIFVAIVVVVLFLWLANLRGVFESQRLNSDKTWEKVNADINKSFEEADKRFSLIADSADKAADNALVQDLLDKASSTAVSKTSTTTITLELTKELLELTKASSTPKEKACPEYINCMPSIGGARPCIIPPGCEKITQIAY